MDEQLQQHSDGQLSCGFCGKKSATTRQNMRNHIETHLDLRLTCDICNKQYSTRNSLNVHKSSIHKNIKDSRVVFYNNV